MTPEHELRTAPPHVHARAFDGELVILDLSTGEYFGLDEIGTVFWQNLTAGKSPSEVATALSAVYAVSSEQLLQDVLKFVAEFEQLGLLILKRA